MLVNQFLSRSVDRYPDKEALICPEGRYLYREIGEKVKEFSDLLLNINVNKSDRVMIFLENSFESVVSIFGVLEKFPQVPCHRCGFVRSILAK